MLGKSNKKFVPGFLVNYQCLRLFNKDWDKDTIIMFDWLMFALHKKPELSNDFSYATISLYTRIERKKVASILKSFQRGGMILKYYTAGKVLNISLDVENIADFLHYAIDRSEENAQKLFSYYHDLIEDFI